MSSSLYTTDVEVDCSSNDSTSLSNSTSSFQEYVVTNPSNGPLEAARSLMSLVKSEEKTTIEQEEKSEEIQEIQEFKEHNSSEILTSQSKNDQDIEDDEDDHAFWKTTDREAINLIFKDIRLEIQTKKYKFLNDKKLQILKGINGYAKSGQLLAILGSSGSGKSSLLNVLAQRTYNGKISGEVLIERGNNSLPVKGLKQIKEIAGYVMQDDFLFPNLTVRETLHYYATLRLPNDSEEQRSIQVNHVVEELRLTHVIDTKIGGEFLRGVSGGERRRVSIGVQLLTNPSVLFLDEPTSGLDSTTANQIVQTLVKLARRGRTILCTIHQPRSDIFKMFDQVMLLSKGELAYFGPAMKMVDYFSEIGYECPSLANPADFAMDLISHTNESSKSDALNLSPEEVKQVIHKGQILSKRNLEEHISRDSPREPINTDKKQAAAVKSVSSSTFLGQFNVLTRRSLLNLVRDKDNITARFFNFTGMAIMFLILLWRLDYSQSSAQNRIGLIYQLISGGVFCGMLNAVALFPAEKTTFSRDNRDGAFSSFAFFASYTAIELVFDLASVIFMSIIVYFGNNLQLDAGKYFTFIFVFYLLQFWGETVGCILCCLFKDPNIANRWTTVILSLFLVIAGFFRTIDGMPYIFKLLNYISIVRYGGKVVTGNEFDGLTFSCDDDQKLADGSCPIPDGDFQINRFSLGLDSRGRDLGLMVVIAFVTRALMFLAIRYTIQKPVKMTSHNEAGGRKSFELTVLPGPDSEAAAEEVSIDVMNQDKSIKKRNFSDLYQGKGSENTKEEISAKIDDITPLTITFSNIDYDVDLVKFGGLKKIGKKMILKNVSGHAKPGSLLAILGTSGSGKSSLLNVLAGRAETGNVTGDLLINGTKVTASGFRPPGITERTGYVTQDDTLLPHLSVRETLTFAALLKLPASLSKQQKLIQVQNVIDELGLSHCTETPIGGELIRGISGGERRRVSIAIQLLTNPSLLFLDEPTSGLDTTTSNNIMGSLLSLARRKRTVVCTIHQPRSAIFYMFDQVMLLSKGEIAYFGAANQMLPFFSTLEYECPKYSNPTDFAMDLITVDTKNQRTESVTRERLDGIINQYRSEKLKEVDQEIEVTRASFENNDLKKDKPTKRATPVFAFMMLFQRAFLNIFRNVSLLSTRTFSAVFLSIMLGVLTYQLKHDQIGALDRLGCVSVMMGVLPYTSILNCIISWQVDRLVYSRERREGMYGALPFYLAKIFSEIPFEIVFTCVFWNIAYWMASLNNKADRFFISLAILLLVLFISQWYGYLFAAIFPQFASANMAANVTFTLFTLVSGWAINYDDIVIAFRWVKDISYLKYGYEALIINEYRGETFYCESHQLINGVCPYTKGEQIISLLSMNSASLGKSFGFLCGFLAFLNIMFYVMIRFKNQRPGGK